MSYTITTTYLDHRGEKQIQTTQEGPALLPATVYTLLEAHKNLKHQVLRMVIEWQGVME